MTIDQSAEIDFNALLAANATRVFSERSADMRRAALDELWSAKGVLYEDNHVVTGLDAISAAVGALLDNLPPGTRFEPQGKAVGHHGLARLHWRGVDAAGVAGPVTGTDVALVENGKISSLYVLIDPMG